MLVKEFALRFCEFSDNEIMVINMLYENESKKLDTRIGGSSLTFSKSCNSSRCIILITCFHYVGKENWVYEKTWPNLRVSLWSKRLGRYIYVCIKWARKDFRKVFAIWCAGLRANKVKRWRCYRYKRDTIEKLPGIRKMDTDCHAVAFGGLIINYSGIS